MAEIIIAQELENGTVNSNPQGNLAGVTRLNRQSFGISTTTTLTKATITFGANSGSPTNNMKFRIETDSAGQASGTLATGFIEALFSPTPSAENTINFDDFIINAGTFWIVLNNVDVQSENVYWNMRYNTTGDYTGGHLAETDDGVWSDFNTSDLLFKLYGLSTEAGVQGYSFFM